MASGAASTGFDDNGRPRPWSERPSTPGWLNKVEIFFSIMQRKVITPNDFADLDGLKQALVASKRYYQEIIAQPFKRKLTQRDLGNLLRHLPSVDLLLAQAA